MHIYTQRGNILYLAISNYNQHMELATIFLHNVYSSLNHRGIRSWSFKQNAIIPSAMMNLKQLKLNITTVIHRSFPTQKHLQKNELTDCNKNNTTHKLRMKTWKFQVWNYFLVAGQNFLKAMARWMITVKAKHFLIMGSSCIMN